MEPEDLDLLYAVENDRELWENGTTNMPYSRFFLREYISSVTGDIYTDKQVRLMVNNSDGDVVGIVDMFDFNPQQLGIRATSATYTTAHGNAKSLTH